MGILSFLRKSGSSAVSNAAGYATGQAASTAIQPAVQPLANDLWKANPSIPTPANVAAQVAIKDPSQDDKMRDEAHKQGFGDTAYAAFKDAADIPPGIGELLELHRRGEITTDALVAGFRSALIEERWLEPLKALSRVLMSPADLAMARQQTFITRDEQITRSALQGVDAEQAELLFQLSGLPPGAGEMLDLWRRGEIDEARFRQSLEEGHLKLDFIDDYVKLKFTPLSASVAAEALIRQRIDQPTAVRIAAENGIQEADFLLWSNMLGRPIAIGEMLTLARRGEFTFEQFKEGVARSDVRTEYADDLWKLREVIPPLFQLVRLITAGSISEELFTSYILKLGYSAELAHGILDAAKTGKTHKQRDLSASMIDELYESGLEPKEWAISALVALGYDAQEAEWQTELIDAKRLLAALTANLNTIHRAYIGHKTDITKATNDLDALGIDPDVRNTLLETWGHERDANVARLTNAQIGSALKKGIVTRDDAIARWMANGYPADDAVILAGLAGAAGNPVSPTAP